MASISPTSLKTVSLLLSSSSSSSSSSQEILSNPISLLLLFLFSLPPLLRTHLLSLQPLIPFPVTLPKLRNPKEINNNPQPHPDSDAGIDDLFKTQIPISQKPLNSEEMDKSMRNYYQKRRKRMYGSDCDDDRLGKEKYIELKPKVIDFPRLHPREEELYFYDIFVFPWEKEKHYRMVYQLKKKYFPDQCLDKAFIDTGKAVKEKKLSRKGAKKEKKEFGQCVFGSWPFYGPSITD